MEKIHVAVLMGGPSAEHDISLSTGEQVLNALDRKKYDVEKIVISRTGEWPLPVTEVKEKFDVAFIAMHGEYGEDGTIQKILEDAGMRFTGSGSAASALGMDKIASAESFISVGLHVPEATVTHEGDTMPDNPFGYPVVVKPVDRGSSVGTTIVCDASDFPQAVHVAFAQSRSVMIQRFIQGKELTCGVLERDGEPFALPPTEIRPKGGTFFDFTAKYTKGASDEITPPDMPTEVIEEIQASSLKAHRVIGARGVSRTDFMISKEGKLFVLEINTIPGMTPTSLLPQEAAVAGISFSKMLDLIIASAMI